MQRTVELARRDFKPAWAKEKGPRTNDARFETAHPNGMFGAGFASFLARSPMTGYFEGAEMHGGKPSYFVHSDGERLVHVAGLTIAEQNSPGGWGVSFTVVPRGARDAAGDVLNGMPAFLDADLMREWLAPGTLEKGGRAPSRPPGRRLREYRRVADDAPGRPCREQRPETRSHRLRPHRARRVEVKAGDPRVFNVQLRPVCDQDAPAVLEAFKSAPDMSRQGPVHDLASARAYVEWLREGTRRSTALVDERGTMIGLVAISVDEENRTGWFFYWLHDAWRGQGLASRAAATVATTALLPVEDGGWGLERLELGHRANNPASGTVARAAGFIHEGTEREKFLIDGVRHDVLTYGRLPTDPVPVVLPLPWATN